MNEGGGTIGRWTMDDDTRDENERRRDDRFAETKDHQDSRAILLLGYLLKG